MRSISLLALFISISLVAHSQRNASFLWQTHVGHNNQWIHLAAEGTLIAAMKDTAHTVADTLDYTSLWGFNPTNGTIKWKYKTSFPRTISGVDPIPNLPFLRLRDVPLTIIDPSDGHTIIDAERESISNIHNFGFLYESGHLWVDGSIAGKRYLSIFELATGKKVWSRSEFFSGPDKTKVSALDAFGSVVNNYRPRLLGTPINHGKDHIILAAGDGIFYSDLFQVKVSTGDIVWKTDAPNPNRGKLIKVEIDTSFFRLIPGPRRFFFVRANWLTACNYNDGKEAWNTPVKTTSRVGEIIYDAKGMILCTVNTDVQSMISTGRFHFVNEETGKELWSQPIKFNGGLTKYQYTEKGLAVVTENPESGASNLNFIDVDKGKYILSNSIRLSGDIRSLQVTPKGVFYATNKDIGIVDVNGKQLIELPKYNLLQGSLPFADAGDKAYVFYKQDQNLYEIDKKNITVKVVNPAKIDFQGNDTPGKLEVRKNGVMLFSNTNVMFINFDGTVRYNIHHKAVWNVLEKLQQFEYLLAKVLDVGRELMAMSIQQQQAPNADARNELDQQMRAYAEVGTAEVAHQLKSFNDVKLRVDGSASGRDVLVILTTLEKKNILAVINKDTGETISKVEFIGDDDSPRYEVDTATDRLFYLGKGMDGLWAYKLR